MLWTVMPLEVVLEGNESFQPSYIEIPWVNGGTLLVEPIRPNRAKVVRLISTDPAHYLNPSLQPGSMMEFKWCQGPRLSLRPWHHA